LEIPPLVYRDAAAAFCRPVHLHSLVYIHLNPISVISELYALNCLFVRSMSKGIFSVNNHIINDLSKKPLPKIKFKRRVFKAKPSEELDAITVKIQDVNLEAGFVKVFGKGAKERVVPIGTYAKQKITVYLTMARLGVLENIEKICAQDQHSKKGHPAQPSPFLCQPSSGRRCGFTDRPGDAGPCRHLHHTDLYPCGQRTSEKDA